MPEIKNTFTQGKMNKDLDERLVPNGQYRDAMNIQLSTSDSSDVGALENILGNDSLMGVIPYYDSSCVGSIVDDKNNSLYWLVAGHNEFKINGSNKDMILQYKDSIVTPVVVDIWRVITSYGGHDDLANTLDFNTLDSFSNLYPELSEVEVGMVAHVEDPSLGLTYFNNNPVINVTAPDPITGVVTVTLQNTFNIGALTPQQQLDIRFIFYKPSGKKVLQFNKTRLITGINILDDFLMFTDNFSEPKKLSIQRCIDGSDGFDKNTRLIVPGRNISINNNILLEEEHVTVIKKAPLTPLLLKTKFDIPTTSIADAGLDDFYFFNSTTNANELKQPGDLINITFTNFANGVDWEVNDEIRFLTGPGQLPQDFQIRAKVAVNLGSNVYTLLLLSVDDDTPLPVAPSTASETYDVYKTPTESPLFERKFPRFSHRYKYEDGEYSTYAPFTDVVFEANSFEYDSKLAYNRGMENFIESLEIRDFIKKDFKTNKTLIPDDVVQIDILYKESDSPTIYVVDKIKYLDGDGEIDATNILGPQGNLQLGLNNWNANLYKVNNDIIYSVVPSNQLLRPYDNVPRVALGQEVTGNRLVFANYLQNFDLPIKPRVSADYDVRYDRSFTGGSLVEYSLDFLGNSTDAPHILKKEETRSDYKGLKTLKSIRDYQIGITYLDEYGRETPVFSSSESNFYVKKKHAEAKTKIVVNAQTDAPGFAKGFKFYVKETDNRYYNLAMDRVYRAEDGNLWLSFPSSERNKVDEDTFLHLKKEIDTNTAVVEEAKYKIVSISNEAPLFIKTETKAVGSSSPGDTSELLSTSPPVIGNRYFEIDEDTWLSGNNTSLTDVVNKMSLDFLADGFYSKRYKVVNFSHTSTGGISGGGVYKVTLDRPLDSEDQWIYPNFPTVLANNLPDFNTSLSLRVYQDIIENKPEHEGKFFVKINGDGITEDRLIGSTTSVSEYEVKARMNSYMLSDSDANYQSGAQTTGNARSDTEDEWEDALDVNDPQDGVIDSEWFLDAAYYPMLHQPISGDKDSGNHVGDGNQNGGFGNGIKQETTGALRWYMEFSFSRLSPDMSDDQAFIGDPDNSNNVPNASMNYADINSNYIWDVGKSTNPPHSNQAKIVDCLVKDSKFRFTGDTAPDSVYGTDSQIYTITDVQVIRRYNHTRWGMYDRDTSDSVLDIRTGSQVPDLHGFVGGQGQWNNLSGNRDGLAGPYFYFRHWKKDHNAHLNNDWDNPTYLQFKEFWERFMNSLNRRTTYRIYLDKDPTTSSSFTVGGNTFSNPFSWGQAGVVGTNNAAANIASATKAQGVEFLQERVTEQQPLVSENPAIWETEPKDSIDLNIYHAASQVYPVNLDASNCYSYVPKGSILTLPGNTTALYKDYANVDVDTVLVGWFDENEINTGTHIALSRKFDEVGNLTQTTQTQVLKFTRHDNSYTTLQFDGKDRIASFPYQDASLPFPISVHIYKILPNVTKNQVGLSWFNALSFSNGVESNTIRDIFNEKFIDKGPIVSTTLDTTYEEERRSSGLIYSGIYNTNSGVNNLNQFIQAEKITKDLNPTYGSVQKLFSRNTDLIALCEDRVIRIQANKDAIFNADGNPQLVASNRVLGQTMPFSGDYGISKNPESFAIDNYRAYFTDKQRSAVLRLSKDGITPISDYGMSDWFGKHIKEYKTLVGSFDSDKGDYNLTLKENYSAYGTSDFTVSYNESVKGWVSFKSFIPENGLSLSNDYYTFKQGYLYIHHADNVDRNTFYSVFENSSVDVLLNAESGSVKNYQTLNYEGSASKITVESVPPGIDSNEYQGYKNLVSNKGGWYTDTITTNKQKGHVNEYIEKEGKWFNYIKGNTVMNNMDIKTEEFSFQGIGRASSVPPPVLGCTDPSATNYDPLANVDDGSCILPIIGCCDPLANNNQNLTAPNICDNTQCTYDDTYDCDNIIGGIIWISNGTGFYTGPTALADASNACPLCIGLAGCDDPTSSNYDPLVVCNDGSCIPCIYGCTDGTIGAPYLPDVDGYCFDSANGIGGILGGILPSPNGICDPNEGYTVNNYDPSATCDDGSCITGLLGCIDSTALNYNAFATVDDGSCTYCTTPCCANNCITGNMDNPDIYGGCVDGTNVGYPNLGGCGGGNGYGPNNYDPNCDPNCPTNCNPVCLYGCMDPLAINYFPGSQVDDGSCIYAGCTDPTALNAWILTYTYLGTTPPAGIITDNTQCCGGGYSAPLYCGDCTMLNYNNNTSLFQGSNNPAYMCVDNSTCITPTTPVMDYDSHYDVIYTNHNLQVGVQYWSGNPFVQPRISNLWGSMDFTDFLVGISSSAYIGDGSSLVYYPDSGSSIMVLNANGNQNAKDKIYELLTTPPITSYYTINSDPMYTYGTIAAIGHIPDMAGNGSGPSYHTDLIFAGNGTCVQEYDMFVDQLAQPTNPGNGTMTMVLERDMSNHNAANNCSVPNVTLTHSFDIRYGCMQVNALNYDINANIADCSCVWV